MNPSNKNISKDISYQVKERRVGETWQGRTGTWFYKRPDGKVVRIDPPGKPIVPETPFKQPKEKPAARIDNRPVELAESRGILKDTLLKLCIFEMNRINELRQKQGLLALNMSELRLMIIDPKELLSGEDISPELISKLQEMSGRLDIYDPDYASDYAPIALEDDKKTVQDGNYRLAASILAGLDKVLVLVPRVPSQRPDQGTKKERKQIALHRLHKQKHGGM
jgi:hypothetical protein